MEERTPGGGVAERRQATDDVDKQTSGVNSTDKPASGGGGSSFGGRLGCLANIIALPLLCLSFYFSCHSPSSCIRYESLSNLPSFSSSFSSFSLYHLFHPLALLLLLGWICLHAVLYALLPGEVVLGEQITPNANRHATDNDEKKNRRLHYTLNGQLHFWLTVCVCLLGKPTFSSHGSIVGFSSMPLEAIQEFYLPLIVWSVLLSFAFSFLLYTTSFRPSATLSTPASGGTAVEQFFLGRELNPRLGPAALLLDLKVLLDLRIGLLGWLAVNLSCCLHQLNHAGHLNPALLALTLFQALYILDAQIQEKCILTTMDITTEGLGFMLVFGNITWVPVMYSLCSRFVMIADPQISTVQLVSATLIFFIELQTHKKMHSEETPAIRRSSTCAQCRPNEVGGC
eukprot:GHVS01059726.1.p1 GENE.GHVS01059726.1~~GHVS01059726.1.p1  ORF type:complete len:399 (+),score=85.07 GHVS01059726.1:145-1341(+)